MKKTPLLLIVTADDLGISTERDQGIFRAFQAGVVTQASLLVEGTSADSAAKKALELGLPMGLHLDFTETGPSAPPEKISSLLDGHQKKWARWEMRQQLDQRRVDPAHLRLEAMAQLEKFKHLCGHFPTHFDGHQHIHQELAMAKVLAPLLAEKGVRTTRIALGGDPTNIFHQRVVGQASEVRAIYLSSGIRATQSFIGMDTMGRAMSLEKLRQELLALRESSSCELMCHPGYVSTIGDEFNRSLEREHELAVLLERPFEQWESGPETFICLGTHQQL